MGEKMQEKKSPTSENEATYKHVELDFNFTLKSFEGEPYKELTDAAKDKLKNKLIRESDLTNDDFRDVKCASALSSFIGSASKSFNDKAWGWRVALYNKGTLLLDKPDFTLLKDFINELFKEGKISLDTYHVNYLPVIENAEKKFNK